MNEDAKEELLSIAFLGSPQNFSFQSQEVRQLPVSHFWFRAFNQIIVVPLLMRKLKGRLSHIENPSFGQKFEGCLSQ